MQTIHPLQQAIMTMWQGLGPFAWLFVITAGVLGAYFLAAWRRLLHHHNPLHPDSAEWHYRHELKLHLVSTGDMLVLNEAAAAEKASLAFAQVSKLSRAVRFIGMVLPAVGLLGTLTGMFQAFISTDFAKGQDLSISMNSLMQSFSMALFTTIAAVILKIAADLLRHFTIDEPLQSLRDAFLAVRREVQQELAGKQVAVKEEVAAPVIEQVEQGSGQVISDEEPEVSALEPHHA